MKQQTVLFDIDGTIFDSKKFTSLVRQACEEKFGISEKKYLSAREAYYTSIAKYTDFEPKDFCKTLSEQTNIAYEDLFALFWKEKLLYEQAVYSDVIPRLKQLQNTYTWGIFSEGVIDYQKHKLEASGLDHFFSPDQTFIFRRKLNISALNQLSKDVTIVDDNKEVVEKMKENRFNIIWLDRKNTGETIAVQTIQSLENLEID